MTLGQGELFDVAPERSVIVPVGAGGYWGVDASSQAASVATIASDGVRGVSSVTWPALGQWTRLPGVYAATFRLGADLVEVVGEPGLVFVEQPSGARPNPSLSYAVGVVAAGLLAGVVSVAGRLPVVERVTSAHWKARSCGSGAISKTYKVHGKVRNLPFEDYGVARWAVANGYVGRSLDEADAWAIAECARRDVALVQR